DRARSRTCAHHGVPGEEVGADRPELRRLDHPHVPLLRLGISWGLVLTGGMNRERCSWPGMIRGVEARIDPAEGAPFRCLTLPCSSTLVRAWMSLRSRRSRTRVRCC